MSNLNLVKNNIERSQKAYDLYKTYPNYHHALHIFNANKVIYEELNKLLASDKLSYSFRNQIYNYIFHLEDWFLQFGLYEKHVEGLEEEFIFEPFKHSIPFPTNFIKDL